METFPATEREPQRVVLLRTAAVFVSSMIPSRTRSVARCEGSSLALCSLIPRLLGRNGDAADAGVVCETTSTAALAFFRRWLIVCVPRHTDFG